MRGKTLSLATLAVLGSAVLSLHRGESIAEALSPARAISESRVHLPEDTLAKSATFDGEHAARPQRNTLERRDARRRKRRMSLLHASTIPVEEVPSLLPIIDQPDIREHHRRIADAVLRLLPSSCLEKLENFYVRYDNPEHRGLAGKTTVILSGNVPDDEFRALLIHEALGHFQDLGCFLGTPESVQSMYRDGRDIVYEDDASVHFYGISWLTENIRREGSRAEDFVSGYASWDAFEDFAESVTYYVLQEDAFRARAETNAELAAKLQWLETFIPELRNRASGKHVWNGKAPWDTTKLPYEWNR